MNFKTTIALLITVIVIGVFIVVTANDSANKSSSQDSSAKATEKPVLTIAAGDILGVKITPRDGKPVNLTKGQTGWRLTSPVDAAAQAYVVQDLLTALVSMKSTSTVKLDGAQLDQTGLKTPDFTVVLAHGEKSLLTVEVGKHVIAGNITFVRVNHANEALVVRGDVYDALSQDASKYRDMTLVQQSTTDVEHVILDIVGKPRIELQKIAGKWQVLQPEKMPADTQRVQSLIGSLTYLRATKFPDAKTVEVARNLGVLNPRITAWFGKASDVATQPATQAAPATTEASTQPAYPAGGTKLMIGEYDGPQRQNVYVTGSAWEGVATVTAGSYTALNIDPLELRDRELADIAPDQVQSIRITRTTQATTQPTDAAPAGTVVAIERYHEPAPGPMGPMLPTTQPASGPASQPATAPAVTLEPPTWIFAGSDVTALNHVSPAKVNRLLASLHPLQVQQFLAEPPQVDVGAEILTIHVEYGQPSAPQSLEYVLVKNGGSYVGRYAGLWFNISGAQFDDAASDFVRTETSEMPEPRGGMPAGMPDFTEFNK